MSIMAAYDALAGSQEYNSQHLSQKYGPETINYFAGSSLNRVSFLRANTPFLRAALPEAQLLLLNNLDPLHDPTTGSLHLLPYSAILHHLPTSPAPFTETEEETIASFSASSPPAPLLIFLGLSPTGTFSFDRYTGTPYFALDVSTLPFTPPAPAAWKHTRVDMTLPPGDAAMFGFARHVLHWNSRNVFCGACGSRTVAVHAGTKRVCPPSSSAACTVRTGVHNLAFPRTDPTVIMAVVSRDGSKVLLGHNAKWPRDFWSTLAGFVEPCESVEDAVRRETWEEAGVKVGRVVVHSSQPWPYPACLMLGCIAEAVEETIDLGNDKELEEARWWPISYVKEVLARKTGGIEEDGVEREGEIRVPPPTAIAHQLLAAVVRGYHGGPKI